MSESNNESETSSISESAHNLMWLAANSPESINQQYRRLTGNDIDDASSSEDDDEEEIDEDAEEDGAEEVEEVAEAGSRHSEDDDWVYPTNSKRNQSYMVRFMRHKLKASFAKDHVFTKGEILAIRPVHIRRWLNKLAYGTETPASNDHPTGY